MVIAESTEGDRHFFVVETPAHVDYQGENRDPEWSVQYRPINMKTGKPWQKSHEIARYNSKAKAMFAWCKAASQYRRLAL